MPDLMVFISAGPMKTTDVHYFDQNIEQQQQQQQVKKEKSENIFSKGNLDKYFS